MAKPLSKLRNVLLTEMLSPKVPVCTSCNSQITLCQTVLQNLNLLLRNHTKILRFVIVSKLLLLLFQIYNVLKMCFSVDLATGFGHWVSHWSCLTEYVHALFLTHCNNIWQTPPSPAKCRCQWGESAASSLHHSSDIQHYQRGLNNYTQNKSDFWNHLYLS